MRICNANICPFLPRSQQSLSTGTYFSHSSASLLSAIIMAAPNPFSQLTDQTYASPPGSLQGADISIESVTRCDLFIMDHTAAVYVDECTDSRIRIGPVAGFCYVRNCSDCIISVACQQFRAKECKNLIVFLYSASDPHLELCKAIAIAPYNFAYPLQDKHFKAAGLNPQANLWSQVYDHTPSSEESNWEVLEPTSFSTLTYQISELGEPIDPVPKPSLYANNGQEGFVVKGSRGDFKAKAKLMTPEDDYSPVILYQEDETKLADVDLSNPDAPSFSPQPKPWAPNPPKANAGSPAPWPNSHKPESGRNSSRLPKPLKSDFSAAENPLLLAAPADLVQYRVLFTAEREFRQDLGLPMASLSPFSLSQTLAHVSETAQPYHLQIRIFTLSIFCVLISGLCLLLALILIEDFVDIHSGGLAIQLFLLVVAVVGLLVYIGIRLRGAVKSGNQAVRQRLEEETVTLYSPSGLTLNGDLFALEITVKPQETIATLLK